MEKRGEEEEHSSLLSSSDSMFMDPSNSDVRRNAVRWLNTEKDFITAEVHILQQKASFLKVLLSFGGKWHIEKGNLERLLTGILAGFKDADLVIQRLWVGFFIRNSSAFFIGDSSAFEKSLLMPTNMDGLLSGMQERLQLLQSDIDKVYTALSESSGFDTDMIDEELAVYEEDQRFLISEAERIQAELKKIPTLSTIQKSGDFCDFDALRRGFMNSQKRLLKLCEKLEIQTCFKNDIKALFSGSLLLDNSFWLLGGRMEGNNLVRQIEGKKKMAAKAGPLTRFDEAGPLALEDETRFANQLKMIETKLKMIDTETELMCPLRNEVQALRLKVSFLLVFPSSKGEWHTEDGKLKALLTRIHSVSQTLDASPSDALERLQLLNSDVEQVYDILSKSSIFISGTSVTGVMGKLMSLKENMGYLLKCNAELFAPVKKELEAVQKRLRFLTNFLSFIAKRCSKPEELRDLLNHAEFPTVKISCLLYLCCVDDKMVNDVKMQLSSELQKFGSALPREIYVKALKALKSEEGISTLVDVFDLCFLDSLRDYILELSDTEHSFMTFNKNQILSLHKALRILTLFLAMDSSSEDQMSNNLLERINAAIISTGCVIYSLNNDEKSEDEARELEIAVSQLQEDARKAYDIYLPNSLRPKFSGTTVHDFIGSLLEIFKEVLQDGVDSSCPLKHQFQVIGDEILSLKEAFNKFHHGELRIQSTHFSDIEYQIRYVIASYFYGRGTLWSHKLGLFNVTEGIRMIKMELEDLQNSMTYDTSVNAEEKKATTVNAAIFKDEAGIGEQLTSGSKTLRIISIEDMSKIEDHLGHMKTLGLKSTEVVEFDLGFFDSLRDYILEFSDTKFCFITSKKGQILSLIEELRFVAIFFVMDKSLMRHCDQMSNNLLEGIITLIINTGCFIYKLPNLDQVRDKSSDMKMAFSNLQDKVKIAKEDARKAYGMYIPKSLWSIFPRTHGQGFIGFLLQNLKELQSTELILTGSLFQNVDQILISPLKHHIEVALKELLSLREEFGKTAKHPNQLEELQWTRFIGLAYQIEYVIDSVLGGGTGPLYHHKLELFDVIREIKTIKMALEAINNKVKYKTSGQKPSCFPSRISLEANSPKNNAVPRIKRRMVDEQTVSELVIFGKEVEEIREKLTNGFRKLNFVSIVGMPGIGKTTLANSVFQHFSSTRHFHVLARYSVSQVHDKRRMLREILQQVTVESKQYTDDDDDDDDDSDLEQKLYQSLTGKRYLIFLDDMWDIQPWKDIRACFPDDEKGSRIMFTSRFDGIASQAGLESSTYSLSPLSEDKSWEMLQVKVFGGESYPPKLVNIGREIASSCKGLPLTVDLIAGILRRKKRENWKEVTESMTQCLLDDVQGRCQNVLELSYKNLPDELKPCFLYFTTFPEDKDVPTNKLFSQWIAEGFVQIQKNDRRSLEDAAEDILNDLIARSLVTVSRSRPLGGVKGTRVHDLLHEFALRKAREDSFMMKIDGKAEKAQWQKQYRLCISDPQVEFISDSSHVRAVICYKSGMNVEVFKLLRVLDIPKGCPMILTLIHLRFLAIRWSKDRIISEIHKLRNLETVILPYYKGDDKYLLLDKVCNMVRLRHFKVGDHFSFRYKTHKILEKSCRFDNLKTLCGLQLSYAEEIEKILKLMPNLVKLKVKFYNADKECYSFPKLDFLKKLESLNVTHDDSQNPCKITSFPPCLKKLVLSKFGVPWIEISKMGNFEDLEVLKLRTGAFEGPTWNMVDGQFPKLKCLSLHDLYIKEWNASEDQLLCLKQLDVKWCKELKELPSCLAESCTLQEINLRSCKEELEGSVNRIKEEQEKNGQVISVVMS